MISLEKAEQDYEKALVGRSEGRPVLVLSTDDIHATYERLKERGVRSSKNPSATRGAVSGRGSWIRTAASSSCSRRTRESGRRQRRDLGKEDNMHGRDLRARGVASVDEYI